MKKIKTSINNYSEMSITQYLTSSISILIKICIQEGFIIFVHKLFIVILKYQFKICFYLLCRQQNNTSSNEGTASLSAFAWHVLREICSQQWVLERCLSHPEELCHPDNLLDPLLTHSQAQRLLHMICYPETSSRMDELDQKSVISMILEVCRSSSQVTKIKFFFFKF